MSASRPRRRPASHSVSLHSLRTFCVVARRLSFKAAARELFITSSAVSHQIKSVEEQLGRTLFERRTREIALTPAGAALYREVAPLFDRLDETLGEFIARAAHPELRLRLPPFFASEVFVPRLVEFSERCPEIEIGIDTDDSRPTSHGQDTDLSVLLAGEPPAGLVVDRLFSLRLVPACSPELRHRAQLRKPADLAGVPLIVHKPRRHAWQDWFAANGIDPMPASRLIVLDTMFAVSRAAERRLGVALVPLPLGDPWFASGALVPLFDRELDTSDIYFLVHRKEDGAREAVQKLRRWIIETFDESA